MPAPIRPVGPSPYQPLKVAQPPRPEAPVRRPRIDWWVAAGVAVCAASAVLVLGSIALLIGWL